MGNVARTATAFTDFAGKRRDGHLVDRIIPQFDGSPMADSNCAACSESVRDISEIARGKNPGKPWEPTGAIIRRETADWSGGLMPTQTAAASRRLYRIGSDIRVVDWNVAFKKLWARYSMTAAIKYLAFSKAGLSGSPGFVGGHSIHILGIRWMTDGDFELLVSDSLCDGRRAGIHEGARWVNSKIVKDASGDLDLGNGMSMIERYGSNHVLSSFTLTPFKVPPPPTEVELAFGAHKIVKPKILRPERNRLIVRTSPRRVQTNHARVMDRRDTFAAWQRVDNKEGVWVGNKRGDRWIRRAGANFVRYIK